MWEVSKQREGNKLFHDPEPGLYKYCLSLEQSTRKYERGSSDCVVGFALRVVGQEAFVKQHKDMSIEERKVIKENFKVRGQF